MDTILAKLKEGQNLSEGEAREAFNILLNGKATDDQIENFLRGLKAKGETPIELAAGAQALRAHAITVDAPNGTLDTCGTGGDGKASYNISTAVAFVVAAGGVPVAKHGNKAVSSKSGSSEILEKLHVRLDVPPAAISQAINETGIGFLFAPAHHSAMAHVAPIRAKIGERTIFNLLGPLANPAGVRHHLLGVFDRKWLRPMAETLRMLGSQSAWIVHGADGLDELTITGTSYVAALADGVITEFEITPEDAGLSRAQPEELIGGTVADNARAFLALLNNEPSAYRDIVALNAGGAFCVAHKATDLRAGVAEAQGLIASGAARAKFEQFADFTRECYLSERRTRITPLLTKTLHDIRDILEKLGDTPSQQKLADSLKLPLGTMYQRVQRLAWLGYIQITPCSPWSLKILRMPKKL